MRAAGGVSLVRCRRQKTHVADSPSDGALFAGGRRLVRLAFDAELHDVVPADGAVVNDNVPSPECHRVPLRQVSRAADVVEQAERYLFDFKARSRISSLGGRGGLCNGGGIAHLDVGHFGSGKQVCGLGDGRKTDYSVTESIIPWRR